VDIAAVTAEQALIARAAYRDFGKGSGHPARLDFGDCFAYALVKSTGEPLLFKGPLLFEDPLLFKGSDFGRTDLTPAIAVPLQGDARDHA
jgi:ribonuclease VapC